MVRLISFFILWYPEHSAVHGGGRSDKNILSLCRRKGRCSRGNSCSRSLARTSLLLAPPRAPGAVQKNTGNFSPRDTMSEEGDAVDDARRMLKGRDGDRDSADDVEHDEEQLEAEPRNGDAVATKRKSFRDQMIAKRHRDLVQEARDTMSEEGDAVDDARRMLEARDDYSPEDMERHEGQLEADQGNGEGDDDDDEEDISSKRRSFRDQMMANKDRNLERHGGNEVLAAVEDSSGVKQGEAAEQEERPSSSQDEEKARPSSQRHEITSVHEFHQTIGNVEVSSREVEALLREVRESVNLATASGLAVARAAGDDGDDDDDEDDEREPSQSTSEEAERIAKIASRSSLEGEMRNRIVRGAVRRLAVDFSVWSGSLRKAWYRFRKANLFKLDNKIDEQRVSFLFQACSRRCEER